MTSKSQHQGVHVQVNEILRRQAGSLTQTAVRAFPRCDVSFWEHLDLLLHWVRLPAHGAPICLVIPADSDSVILVPDLEREHAELASQTIGGVRTYPEYPGERHPMSYLEALMKERRFDQAKVGLGSLVGCQQRYAK